MPESNLYDPSFVKGLFDEMAQTYGIVNLISSFGFTFRWRRQCLNSIDIRPESTVADLMTGMGELCPGLIKILGPKGKILAVDISPIMCQRARQQVADADSSLVQVVQADALFLPNQG